MILDIEILTSDSISQWFTYINGELLILTLWW